MTNNQKKVVHIGSLGTDPSLARKVLAAGMVSIIAESNSASTPTVFELRPAPLIPPPYFPPSYRAGKWYDPVFKKSKKRR
jgi:hypothetical protein